MARQQTIQHNTRQHPGLGKLGQKPQSDESLAKARAPQVETALGVSGTYRFSIKGQPSYLANTLPEEAYEVRVRNAVFEEFLTARRGWAKSLDGRIKIDAAGMKIPATATEVAATAAKAKFLRGGMTPDERTLLDAAIRWATWSLGRGGAILREEEAAEKAAREGSKVSA
ncbi:MAG: hypothetical protein WBP12_03450 [Candidatus Saccharimonas sp.]